MLWDMIQQAQINDALASSENANRRTDQIRRDADRAQSTLDTLTLTCAAMWELLSEKLGVTDQELLAKIEEIDLRDGKLDGKIASAAQQCPGCARANNSQRLRCIYCGTVLPRTPF